MDILVEYKDAAGTLTHQTHTMSLLAFAKHFAIAGQGYAPKPQKLIRTFSMFFHYCNYLQRSAFNENRFSEPPIELSDPTEKGQFSNIVGKAIADFLSKRIDQSLFTVNYEAAMRLRGMPINVERPDLLAYKKKSMFALEAKGYSGGYGKMTNHKNQSLKGGIPVNFTVACISYDLYKKIKCKYHDPFNDNVSYDNELLRSLTRSYYHGLGQFLNQKFFDFREFAFQGEKFFEIELPFRYLEKQRHGGLNIRSFWWFELIDYYRPRLIVPKKIFEYAEVGITNEIEPFIFDISNEDYNIYIDNDRVGLRIR